ncbi:hypothetical protein KUCAC02_036066, partial [Chaenocephalus aceratus]
YDTTTDNPGIYRGPLSLPTCKMDTTDPKIQRRRRYSRGRSCLSMKSDWSIPVHKKFKNRPRSCCPDECDSISIHHERPDSPESGPSCVSMKSGNSMPRPIRLQMESIAMDQ